MPSRARGVNVFHPGMEVDHNREDSPGTPPFDEMQGSPSEDDEPIPWGKVRDLLIYTDLG